MAKQTVVDVDVRREGNIFLFTPHTTAAREWIEENVTGEVEWFANAMIVDQHCARDLADGMQSAGLVVE